MINDFKYLLGVCAGAMVLSGCLAPLTLAQREADNKYEPAKQVEWARHPDLAYAAAVHAAGRQPTTRAEVSSGAKVPVIQDIPLTALNYAGTGSLSGGLLAGELIMGLNATLGEDGRTQTERRLRLMGLYNPRLLLLAQAPTGEDYEAVFQRLAGWVDGLVDHGLVCGIRGYSESGAYVVAVTRHKPGHYHLRDYVCTERNGQDKWAVEALAFAADAGAFQQGFVRIYRLFPKENQLIQADFSFGLFERFRATIPPSWGSVVTGPDWQQNWRWRAFDVERDRVVAADLPRLWEQFHSAEMPVAEQQRRPLIEERLRTTDARSLLVR